MDNPLTEICDSFRATESTGIFINSIDGISQAYRIELFESYAGSIIGGNAVWVSELGMCKLLAFGLVSHWDYSLSIDI